MNICEHGVRHPWACEQCDDEALQDLHKAAPKLYDASVKVLAWWDEKLANELSSHRDFPWAEDAEWDQFFNLRNALKEARGES